MSVASAAAQSCVQGCATASNALWGSSYPASLALLWPLKLSAPGVLKSAVGPAPTFTDTPTVDSDGVTPGDGPSFTDVVSWADGGTLVVEFTATTASADIVGDVQVFGPLYAYSGGLKAKDGVNVASVATSWDVGDVVTAVVYTLYGRMVVSRAGVGGLTATNNVTKSNTITDSSWSKINGSASGIAFTKTAGVIAFGVLLKPVTIPSTRCRIVWKLSSAVTQIVTAYVTNEVTYASVPMSIWVTETPTEFTFTIDGLNPANSHSIRLYIGSNLNGNVYSVNVHDVALYGATDFSTSFDVGINTNTTTSPLSALVSSVDIGPWNNAVAVGDSILAAASSSLPYVSVPRHINSYGSLYIENKAVSGYTLTQIKANFLAYIEGRSAVIINGGINEIVTVEYMRERMEWMILTAVTSGLQIVVIGCSPFGSASAWTQAKQDIVMGYNAEITAYCQSLSVPYIDTYTMLKASGDSVSLGAQYDSGDGLHPNGYGKRLIADACVAAMQQTPYATIVNPGGISLFDSTIPALALSPTAPGDLRSVQTWSKVATAQEIHKVTKYDDRR